jgi:tripeptide aminopeptidase
MTMNNIISRTLDLAIDIQQIPAPTFHETSRAEFVLKQFIDEGLADVEMDGVGNVFARLPVPEKKSPRITNAARKDGSAKPLVVSAHLDTVFPAGTDLRVEREPERILAPGIGDNSLGVAALFGLVWELRQHNLPIGGDLWLVANTGEEGLGDLRGMKSVVGRFESQPLAYLVLEGIALGHIYHRGLGVRRYRIIVRTAGGHSWLDYGQPSAIHELTALSTRIAALKPPSKPRTTLNIGVISGGSSVNTIAAEARLELDLRSESAESLAALAGQVQQLVHARLKPGVEVEVEIIGQRPSGEIPVEHPLVKLAQDCLHAVGIEPHLSIGSTDANLPLSLGYPSLTVGLTTGGRAHTVHEFINIPPLEKGVEQVFRLVSKAWEVHSV